MRYLDMSDLTAIDRMTFYEYRLKMTAHALKVADREWEIHLQAWLNREVEAKRKAGKDKLAYVYTKMEDFFDYKKRVNDILHRNTIKDNPAHMSQADRYAEFMRRKKNGEL